MLLSSKIKKWVKAELISESTGQAILDFEKKGTSNNALYGFLWVGALAIIVGIISIIAANWTLIPKEVKLISNFLWLLTLSYGVLKTKNLKNSLFFEVLLFILFGSFLGTIALIGQVYHLESHLFFSMGLWLLIGTPLALFSQTKYTAYSWGIVYVITAYLAHDYFLPFNIETRLTSLAYVSFAVIYLYWLFDVTQFRKSYFAEAIEKYSQASFFIFIILLGGLRWINDVRSIEYLHKMIIVAASIPLAWFITKKYDITLALIFLLGLGYAEIPEWFYHSNLKLIGAFYFLLLFTAFAYWGVKNENKKVFEFSIFVISLRIIVVYFEVFGSLLQTGIGLVVTGLFILLIGYLWFSQKDKLWKRGV